jgi:molecular chaperone GrpE
MTDDEASGGAEAPPPDGGTPPDGTIPVIVEGPEGEGGDGVDPAAGRIKELEAALATAEKEKKDTWDKYVRSVADLENRQKRAKRELEDARTDAKIRVLKEMLPVVDNLERAVEHAQAPGPETSAIVDGVRLVLRQFQHAFERLDVVAVEADGQPFDPNVHEAISQIETDDKPPGTVVSVLQKGYRIGERLLRPAMVVVAKARAGEPPTQDEPKAAGSE